MEERKRQQQDQMEGTTPDERIKKAPFLRLLKVVTSFSAHPRLHSEVVSSFFVFVSSWLLSFHDLGLCLVWPFSFFISSRLLVIFFFYYSFVPFSSILFLSSFPLPLFPRPLLVSMVQFLFPFFFFFFPFPVTFSTFSSYSFPERQQRKAN